jgi:hypothetical protein
MTCYSISRSKTILEASKFYWTGPNSVNMVQNIKFSSEKFGCVQNNFNAFKAVSDPKKDKALICCSSKKGKHSRNAH